MRKKLESLISGEAKEESSPDFGTDLDAALNRAGKISTLKTELKSEGEGSGSDRGKSR